MKLHVGVALATLSVSTARAGFLSRRGNPGHIEARQSPEDHSSEYVVPVGSPGFYAGQSKSAVTFDQHSVLLSGKRFMIFSGEIHPWRNPTGVPAWRDLLEKMKAAGFNTVSVYHHWGVNEQKQGYIDFTHFRSHEDFYKLAKEIGIYVISRPGPYINAETAGGGIPGWFTNIPEKIRTNETTLWKPYIEAVAKAIIPYQYPAGPVIAIQAENEFAPFTEYNAPYMQQLEDWIRESGVTKIPITTNDFGIYAHYAHGLGKVDLWQWDMYPNGFNCKAPFDWKEVVDVIDSMHRSVDPSILSATAEFQGGSLDTWGGAGYDQCRQLLNEEFENVFYKNNYAAGVTWQSLYMLQGGTNWGNLASPDVYTSYDVGAAISEQRTLTPKYYELKLQGLFLHASPAFLTAVRIGAGPGGAGTPNTDSADAYVTNLKDPKSGTNFYFVRQKSNTVTAPLSLSLRVNTTAGALTIPQYGGAVTLGGRESKIIVTDYAFGSHKLQYSTAEIMTWATIDQTDYLILYATKGQQIEAVIPNVGGSASVSGSSSVTAKVVSGSAVISGSPSGVSAIRFKGITVLVIDKHTALSFWNPRLASTQYDLTPSSPSVIVSGPYLVRSATIVGSTLVVKGDINGTTTLDVFGPASVKAVTWNGKAVAVKQSDIGSLRGVLNYSLGNAVQLPKLSSLAWKCADSLPEVQDNYDDRAWTTASHTSTVNPHQPYAGKYVVYASEYKYHGGNTIFRGHFIGTATGVDLSVQGGNHFGYCVWLGSYALGCGESDTSDVRNDTWTFPAAALKKGENVLTVVLDPTGMETDWNVDDRFKLPRGVRGYKLLGGGDFTHWKVAGNVGGEDFPDKVRGIFNEGGLFVERQGAHLPGYPTANWKSCSLAEGLPAIGIKAYRTTFNLNLPANTDIPVGLKVTRNPSSNYRGLFYVNGWSLGKYKSRLGPQEIFPLPEGILNHHGKNELLLTLWPFNSTGAHFDQVELVPLATLESSKVPATIVASPGYAELRR